MLEWSPVLDLVVEPLSQGEQRVMNKSAKSQAKALSILVMSLLALMLALLWPPGGPAFASASAPGADFCDSPSANPYLRHLNQLPGLPEPPEDSGLPFAPVLSLNPVRGPLVIHGEPIGFILQTRQATTWKRSPWKVRAVFSLLAKSGQVKRVVKQAAGIARSSHPMNLTFTTLRKSATYRVEVMFEKRDGTFIARYGAYFRAAPPKFASRIALHSEQVGAGDKLSFRLENMGTQKIGAGYGYRIERFTGTAWEVDASLQSNKRVPRVLVILGPSATFDCVTISIPDASSPGRYRVVKAVMTRTDGPAKRVEIAKEFVVR